MEGNRTSEPSAASVTSYPVPAVLVMLAVRAGRATASGGPADEFTIGA